MQEQGRTSECHRESIKNRRPLVDCARQKNSLAIHGTVISHHLPLAQFLHVAVRKEKISPPIMANMGSKKAGAIGIRQEKVKLVKVLRISRPKIDYRISPHEERGGGSVRHRRQILVSGGHGIAQLEGEVPR